MNRPGVNGRFALSVSWPGERPEGWLLLIGSRALVGGADPVISASDPTGHLTVSGRLSDINRWATDLMAQTTMIQVQLSELHQTQDETGGTTGEWRTDGHDHG